MASFLWFFLATLSVTHVHLVDSFLVSNIDMNGTKDFLNSLAAKLDLPVLPALSSFTLCSGKLNIEGTCQALSDCDAIQGLADGNCSDPLNSLLGAETSEEMVCCVKTQTCDTIAILNGTIFTNPGYPSSTNEARICDLQVPKESWDVRQLRLDIIELDLAQPTSKGCTTDALLINGASKEGGITYPLICGTNKDQHMYIDVEGYGGPFYISIRTSGDDISRKWAIKVTQLTSLDYLAPKMCLQYFRTSTGHFESFNNPNGIIPHVNYAICIDPLPTLCNVLYTPIEFNLSPPAANGSCEVDYMTLPSSYKALSPQCGSTFNSGDNWLASRSGPYVVAVGSNGNAEQTRGKGFSFTFDQMVCPQSKG